MSRHDQFDYLFKIVMIGDSGVGKTNLLSRFVDGSFTMDSKPTIGVQFATKTLNTDGKIIKNQIWDTAGQQRFRAITNAYYRGAVGAIIVFDLTKSRTFDNIQKWYAQLKDNAQPDITIMLLGNKCDLQGRQVKQSIVQDYATTNKLLYMETSALNGHNVEEGFGALIKEIYEKMKIVPQPTPNPITQKREDLKQLKKEQATVEQKTQSSKKGKDEKNLKLKDDKKKGQEKKKGCC